MVLGRDPADVRFWPGVSSVSCIGYFVSFPKPLGDAHSAADGCAVIVHAGKGGNMLLLGCTPTVLVTDGGGYKNATCLFLR